MFKIRNKRKKLTTHQLTPEEGIQSGEMDGGIPQMLKCGAEKEKSSPMRAKGLGPDTGGGLWQKEPSNQQLAIIREKPRMG